MSLRVLELSDTTPISSSLFKMYDWSLGISARTSSRCSKGDLGVDSSASVAVVSLYKLHKANEFSIVLYCIVLNCIALH